MCILLTVDDLEKQLIQWQYGNPLSERIQLCVVLSIFRASCSSWPRHLLLLKNVDWILAQDKLLDCSLCESGHVGLAACKVLQVRSFVVFCLSAASAPIQISSADPVSVGGQEKMAWISGVCEVSNFASWLRKKVVFWSFFSDAGPRGNGVSIRVTLYSESILRGHFCSC